MAKISAYKYWTPEDLRNTIAFRYAGDIREAALDSLFANLCSHYEEGKRLNAAYREAVEDLDENYEVGITLRKKECYVDN